MLGPSLLVRRVVSSASKGRQPALRLTYLNAKGLAEPIRLALTIGGIPFEDKHVGYPEVHTLRQQGRHGIA